MLRIEGTADAGFATVAEAFRANFADQHEVGAAVCIYRHGRPVVDLRGGVADAATARPWRPDTMAVVFSATKGVTAACVHLLAERGVLDLDAPLAQYWPEFGCAGKATIPVRWVLGHRAGLPLVEAELTREEVFAWFPVVRAIAAQTPVWEPGTQHGYHVRTWGWMLGELVRRITGMTIGQFIAKEVAAPLAADFHLGLPEGLEPRVATLYPPGPPTDPAQIALMAQLMGPGTFLHRALIGPADLAYGEVWNSRALHAAEIPSSNGICTAHALARFYAALVGQVDGRRLLSAATVEAACHVVSDGHDAVVGAPTRFGSGFMLPPALSPDCSPTCFGHPGAGGSLAFADPSRELAFAYVTNQLKLEPSGDERTRRLVRALYAAADHCG
ncbi:MAG: serine hydrolase domain-containing protein [Candidatus Binatia bacterium]